MWAVGLNGYSKLYANFSSFGFQTLLECSFEKTRLKFLTKQRV